MTFNPLYLLFCTKFTLKLGVISISCWKFLFHILVDPYRSISNNHTRVRCYQARGETRILITTPALRFSISPTD
ncbi:hypothetical protein HanRHA438_Chr16g0753651 [Helianthus annuus]|nr:hypothetical protein HanRHA438_Chr16g0753651 [Helianthus annuus]